MLLKKQIKLINHLTGEILWMKLVHMEGCKTVCLYYRSDKCRVYKSACILILAKFRTRRYIPKNAAKEKIDKE